MLSSWVQKAAYYVDSRLQAAGLSVPIDARTLSGDYSIHFDHLKASLPVIPEDLMQCAAGLYGEMLHPVRKVLASDIKTITQLLLELETNFHSEGSHVHDSEPGNLYCKADCDQQDEAFLSSAMAVGPQDLAHKARTAPTGRRPLVAAPIVIPSTHPAAPTITISPCGSQNQEATCRVPCQNSAFGKMLTVPLHSSYNDVHPPMAPSSPGLLMPVPEDWRWNNGHWEAVLPCPQQQTRRGMFSIMHSTKRRSRRPCTHEN